ncbi:MAG: hypothetical protein JW871_07455 [Endomicrobiales bacterium]|nr:hypothetical protein [Endomicrobiales bacterium]
MRKLILIVLISILAVTNKVIAADDVLNVGVAEFSAENVPLSDAVTISNFFRTGLVNTNLFNVLERGNMDIVLAEQNFQLSGCTDYKCAVKMGKLLNVQKMIIGNLTVFAKQYYITASVVDIETGKIVHSEKVSCKSQEELPNKANDLAILIAESMTKKKTESRKHSRRRITKNCIRTNIGSFIFLGGIKNVDSNSLNYNISFRKQGMPFIKIDNTYTELEIGYFTIERTKDSNSQSDYKIEYIPSSFNIQHYLSLPFVFEIYSKTGLGMSYGKSAVSSSMLNKTVSEISFDPLMKVGIGLDLTQSYNLGFQIEILYNHYLMKETDLTGITINGGLSYNW